MPRSATSANVRSLVQPLFDGPIDVVGDIHGELDALHDLLRHSGYCEINDGTAARHPAGRRLVFVGDYTDRGPDSPGVVRLIRQLCIAGIGQAVLGNHDLNLLLGLRKFDNGWFWGQEFRTSDGHLLPQIFADEATRGEVLDFFASLPVALERPGVRVIHAYWDAAAIELARAATDVVALYREHEARIDAAQRGRSNQDEVDRELAHQLGNPVKLLTSGPERRAVQPKMSSGKLRRLERAPWWPDYQLTDICLFGHYGIMPSEPHGHGRALCVDYAVGKRSLERAAGAATFQTKLAALRLPEREIVFDDGTTQRWNSDR